MIEKNQFGEIISVNGITTGQHIGKPMQDIRGTDQSNEAYAVQKSTVFNGKSQLEFTPNVESSGTYVRSVNGIEPDTKGNVNIEVSSGMPSGDAPFQQLVTDADGKAVWEERLAYSNELPSVTANLGLGDMKWYKVSDAIPTGITDTEYANVWLEGSEQAEEDCYVQDLSSLGGYNIFNFAVVVVTGDELDLSSMGVDVQFPHGTWFLYGFSANGVSMNVTGISCVDATSPEITFDGNTGETRTIDSKYLPKIPKEPLIVNIHPTDLTCSVPFVELVAALTARERAVLVNITIGGGSGNEQHRVMAYVYRFNAFRIDFFSVDFTTDSANAIYTIYTYGNNSDVLLKSTKKVAFVTE